MIDLDFVFTDGHAIEVFSSQYSISDIGNIETLLDWNAIKAKYWTNENDLDLKRKKQSEFLVLGDITIGRVLGYITYNEISKKKVVGFGADASKVVFKPEFYF
jgi:hypothetical protein